MAARTYPFSDAQALEVDPTFQELLAEEPVSRVRLPFGGEAWLVVRYGDVRTVLSDPRFSRAELVGKDVPRVRPEIADQGATILDMDPPDHTRLRKLVAKAFTVRRVSELRPRARELTAEMLAGMRAEGSGADLVEHLSVPLPVTIICELLGVPVADRPIFRAGSDSAMSMTSQTPEQRQQSLTAMIMYMAGLVAQRREHPTDDLLGALVVARDDGDKLTEAELISLSFVILVAGHETTMNQISNMTYVLLTRPDRGAALRGDDAALAHGIEELLRFTPLGASAGFPRVATQDVELSGVTIRAGEIVYVATQSANRDPDAFPDPQELRLDRAMSVPHVAFGHGVHHCLGAQLARMELQEAIGGMLREFPDLRLAVDPAEVRWRTGGIVRDPEALPLAWG